MEKSITSRRNFVKSMGAATVLLSSAPMIATNFIIPRAKKKLGVALVGLGNYSTNVLAPALQVTENCALKGIVTGSPEKIPVWQEKYGIADKNVYNYENMHQVADNPDIDIIYIVLPPGLHSKYSIIAANAGKHVWCEKPMAVSEEECQAMIDACNKNKVKLSIGYRLHHEPNTQRIMRLGREKPYGPIEVVTAEAGYFDRRTDHWKQNKELGGGAMLDMGVYPINAARYSAQEEPVAVISAKHEILRPEIYHEVDETTYFKLEFPSGAVAECATSLGKRMQKLRIDCENGWYWLKPFQSYSGIKGETSDGEIINEQIPNQQARQMDNDTRAIVNNRKVLVPGEEGLRDIRIVEAVYKSARLGQRVAL